jgi:hypothetical protein
MTKFVVVKEAPKDLTKECYVIEYPTFLEEIMENKRREPRGNLTANAHLRGIIGTIASKYDPDNFLAGANIKPHLFEGRAYSTDEELSKIVVEMLQSQYPEIFERHLEHKIANRPLNVKVIYYTGPYYASLPFFKHGIDKIDEKEVENYLTGKKNKK